MSAEPEARSLAVRSYGLALAADGEHLASGSEDGTIRRWEVCSGKCLRTLRSDRRYENAWALPA
jgi:WD40 repeat protein